MTSRRKTTRMNISKCNVKARFKTLRSSHGGRRSCWPKTARIPSNTIPFLNTFCRDRWIVPFNNGMKEHKAISIPSSYISGNGAKTFHMYCTVDTKRAEQSTPKQRTPVVCSCECCHEWSWRCGEGVLFGTWMAISSTQPSFFRLKCYQLMANHCQPENRESLPHNICHYENQQKTWGPFVHSLKGNS